MQLSTGSRNDSIAALVAAMGASPLIKLFGTAAPANCAAADNGASISDGVLPVAPFAAPANGQEDKAGTWQSTGNANAGAGVRARHFRLYDSAGTTCHAQGIVSMPWFGSSPVLLNQHWENGGNVYICTTPGSTAPSGGPTGTGTGITDGTVVWDYLGLKDMGIDNTSITENQVTTVNSFTLIQGGA